MVFIDEKDLEEMLNEIISELSKKSGKKKIVYVDATSDTTVPAGSSETITVQPPEGKIWRIKMISYGYFEPPTGATSGSHNVIFYQEFIGLGFRIMSNYNKAISFNFLEPQQYTELEPSEFISDYHSILEHFAFTYNYPLRVKYENSTDADQTAKRSLLLLIEEEEEAL